MLRFSKHPVVLWASLAAPAALLIGELAIVAGALPAALPDHSGQQVATPPVVEMARQPGPYRSAGVFQRNGAVIDAPILQMNERESLSVTRDLVSLSDYMRCVRDNACAAPRVRPGANGDVPVTGVSFDDAQAYAQWLSAKTSEVWRLPTDREWVALAGSRFHDPALGVEGTASDPAQRWLAAYELANSGRNAIDAVPRARGSFGVNEFGIADLSGNVWEWTSTCFERTTLATNGVAIARTDNCGVRVVEGAHRTYISHFVRDARGGGCSVGAPPDNLGFRLVRDTPASRPLGRLVNWWKGIGAGQKA